MKYKLYLQSYIEIEIEADSKGKAQQELFERLRNNYFETSLKENCMIGFVNSQVTPDVNAERTLEENKTKKPLVSPDINPMEDIVNKTFTQKGSEMK